MSSSAQEDYDRVLYPGAAHTQTHPDRLATLACLFGMQPASLDRCRVLEIGCTDGGNLIPMAHGLPDADFTGIDIGTRSLAVGRECIAELGLKNIRLLELDILDVPGDFGAFDYIIAHGIYSWVPPVVREKVLAICRAHLAPHGVAYISYNVYPGSHVRDAVRGMMRFHVRDTPDPEEKRRQATALLRFVVDSQPESDPFRSVLAAELNWLAKSGIASFYHDDLAENRAPFYFHEFIADAARHDLQFLSEASFHEMQAQVFPPKVAETLEALGPDRIAREQYLDFLKNRRFRQTLLCRREVALSAPSAEPVRRFHISSRARPASANPSLEESALEEFTAPGNASVKTGSSLAKAALLHVAEIYPHSISFNDLLSAARHRLVEKSIALPNDAAPELADALLAMYAAPIVQFHLHAPRFTTDVSERPLVSPIARWCLARGADTVTNLRHRGTRIEDPIAAQLMLLLDGTRDRPALVAELATFCAKRSLIRHENGTPITDPAQLRAILTPGLDTNLRKLARMAVLVAV